MVGSELMLIRSTSIHTRWLNQWASSGIMCNGWIDRSVVCLSNGQNTQSTAILHGFSAVRSHPMPEIRPRQSRLSDYQSGSTRHDQIEITNWVTGLVILWSGDSNFPSITLNESWSSSWDAGPLEDDASAESQERPQGQGRRGGRPYLILLPYFFSAILLSQRGLIWTWCMDFVLKLLKII